MDEEKTILPWFALLVRTSWEKMAASALQSRGYDCLLPLYASRRRWSDRVKELELPLFPGYLFCRLDPGRRLPVLQARGVLQIVSCGRAPIPVNEEEIAAIRSVLKSGLPRQPWPYVQAGETVEIEEGPLRGLSGLVVEVKSELKLILSVTLLKRSVSVELDPAWVRSVPNQRATGRVAEFFSPKPSAAMRVPAPAAAGQADVAGSAISNDQLKV